MLWTALLLALAPTQPARQAPQAHVALELPGASRPSANLPQVPALLDGRHLRSAGEAGESSESLQGPLLPASLVTGLVQEELARSRNRARLVPGGDGWLAIGAPEEVARVRGLVDALDAVEKAVEIELSVELVSGAEAPLWAETRSVRPGEEVVFGSRRSDAFLAGYEVDVASDSAVADPLIRLACSGTTLHLRAHRLGAGGLIWIEGLLDVARPGQVERVDTGSPDLGVVELPQIDVLQLRFHGEVDADGRLTISARGAAAPDGLELAIRARTGEIATEGLEGWTAVEVGSLVSLPQGLGSFGPGWALEAEEQPGGARDALPPSSLTTGSLVGLVADVLPAGVRPLWSDTLICFPPGAEAGAEALRGLADALSERRLGGGRLTLEGPDARVELPCSRGVAARAIAGREHLVLVDYDTQLAPETWIAEPRVVRVFDGWCVEGEANRDDFRASSWIARSDSPRELAVEEVGLGRLQLPQRALRSRRARLADGNEIALLSSETSGDPARPSFLRAIYHARR